MNKMRFMLTLCFSVISMLTFSNVQPKQDIVIEKVLFSKFSSIPTMISFSKGNEITVTEVSSFLAKYFDGNQSFSLKLVGSQSDELGFIHYRYQQQLDGIPVSNAYYVVHTKNNMVLSMNGLLFDQIETVSSNIDEVQALDLAKKYISANVYMWENFQEEQLLKRQTNNSQASYLPVPQLMYVVNPSQLNQPMRLGYRVTIYASEPLSKQDVYIDATTGKIIYVDNLLHFKDVKGKANTVYSGNQTITTDSTSTGYTLREAGRGNGIETYNMMNGINFSSYIDFTDNNNVWDTINAQKDQYAVDAHWGAEMVYDYYLQKHNRNSIDNNGFKLINMVHYGSAFGNAYWDGSRMVFGDGDGTNTKNPLVSLDIIGHEITHGLTSNTAKLISQNEPGALNESFSDIFGATIDWYARPSQANWKVGDEISSVYRSLEDPNSTNNPDTYHGNHWIAMNDVDFGGIHNNNGVQNYWYYLLVQGGNGVNDNGSGYNVTGIGIDKAAAIVYRNLTVYMTSLSNFQDARFFAIQSAIDLFGSCSPEVEAVTNAWYAVGVGAQYNSKVTSKFEASYGKSCRALKVNFTNMSDNAISYNWDFGDGTFSTESNPSHIYSVPGNYSVKLVAKSSGECGVIDSIVKVDWVNVYPYNGNPISVQLCSQDALLKLTTSINNPVWFANDTSKIVLNFTNTLEIKNPNKDTSFFVGSLDVISDSTWKVGETNVSTNIGSYAATVRYQIFDVFKPVTIKSVLVNAYTADNRVIELRDVSGNVLQTKTVNIPIGVSRVDLNFEVDPGVDYQLGLGGSIGNLGRSNAGINYPYVIKDVLSIKGSNAVNAGLQFYYSFYDWEVVYEGCKDARQEYKVVQKECTTSQLLEVNSETLKVYPNPTTGIVKINKSGICQLRVYNSIGCLMLQPSTFVDSFDLNISHLSKGIYYLEIKDSNSPEIVQLVKD